MRNINRLIPENPSVESTYSLLDTEIKQINSPHYVLNGGPLAEKGIDNWSA